MPPIDHGVLIKTTPLVQISASEHTCRPIVCPIFEKLQDLCNLCMKKAVPQFGKKYACIFGDTVLAYAMAGLNHFGAAVACLVPSQGVHTLNGSIAIWRRIPEKKTHKATANSDSLAEFAVITAVLKGSSTVHQYHSASSS